jgi:small nuclear ribonucleoprotein G
MSKNGGPDLKRYMDKRLNLRLNGNRKVEGVLRGFDQFMNVVLDETQEEVSSTESNDIGMVVVRGNSIIQFECLDRI